MKWQTDRVSVGVQTVHLEYLSILPASCFGRESFALSNLEPCRNRQYSGSGHKKQEC
jgi:hypothetical protein